MNNNERNILKISDWKEFQEEKSLLKYLRVLNFHDLMTEAEQALKELNSNPINKEITLRSKSILKEFSNRLKADRDGFAGTLSTISDSIEDKFGKLKELL